MMTDSHCHLASHRFDAGEVAEVLSRARLAGVGRLVTLATGLHDLEANLEIARHQGVFACLGIHPCDVHNSPDDAPERIARRLSDPRVCAVGETGLDYYHPAPDGWTEAAYRERQRDFLRRHFLAARNAGLNVVVHTRDRGGSASLDDALAIYQDFHTTTRALFHCFIAPIHQAERIWRLGGMVSFGGVCTFKNAGDARATAVASPAGTFMLETDSPYLAPEPHRGKRNEPAWVAEIARFLAAARGEPLSDLVDHTNRAADGFFRFAES